MGNTLFVWQWFRAMHQKDTPRKKNRIFPLVLIKIRLQTAPCPSPPPFHCFILLLLAPQLPDWTFQDHFLLIHKTYRTGDWIEGCTGAAKLEIWKNITHFGSERQAGRFGGWVGVGVGWRGRISGEQGMGCMCVCVREMVLRWGEENHWGQRREGRYSERRGEGEGMQAQNMFWNINPRFWPWAGAQRWKKAGEPLKRGNVPCVREAGAAQTAILVESNWGRCNVSPSHLRALVSTLPHTAYWCRVYLECSLFPSSDTNEMSVVQSLNPQCLVKPLNGIPTAA